MAAGGRRVVPAASPSALADVAAVVVAVFVIRVNDFVIVVVRSCHYDFGNSQGQEAIGGGGCIPRKFGRGHGGRRSQDEIVVAPGPGGADGRRPRSRPPRGGVLDRPCRPRAVRGGQTPRSGRCRTRAPNAWRLLSGGWRGRRRNSCSRRYRALRDRSSAPPGLDFCWRDGGRNQRAERESKRVRSLRSDFACPPK